MSDIFDTTKEAKNTVYSIEDPSSVEGEFADVRFRHWEYETMKGEVKDLIEQVSELRKAINNGGINQVSDAKARTMITEFILEQKKAGKKRIKGPEISENLCLPANQVERVLDAFVEKKKLSRT
ncbi:MAG TPA: hypothetical protein VGA53_03760 [Candidatus Paceibacterota bacterium]